MAIDRYTFKIIAAGDGGVGKTTLLRRFIENRFYFDTIMTIGVEIFHKPITPSPNALVDLQLWDFGGEEQFRFFQSSFVKGASGALLMFDLTMAKSFRNLGEWLKILRSETPSLPILLLGSKLDLTEKILIHDEDVADLMKKEQFAGFLKVSSKTGQNVNESFKILTDAIFKHKKIEIS